MDVVVIDYEILSGQSKEPIVKELAVATKDVVQTFHFAPPYAMHAHGSDENGLNWADGNVPYKELHTVVSEAVANFPHVYAFGSTKCTFLSDLLKRSVLNLEDFKCPTHDNFVPEHRCWLPCHKYPNVRCAAKNAESYYKWLMYHFKTKSHVKCTPEHTRHTADFLSAI